MAVEHWILDDKIYGLERVFGVPQLFLKWEFSRIKLIVEKATEDFLVSGKLDDIRHVMLELSQAFNVVK